MTRSELYSSVLLAGAAAAFAASVIFIALAPARYTAQTLIRVEPDPYLTQPGSRAPGLSPKEIVLNRIGSVDLIAPTVDKFALNSGGFFPASAAERRNRAIAAVRNGMAVERAAGGLWTLTYRSDRPDINSAVLDDVVKRAAVSDSAQVHQGQALEGAGRISMAATAEALAGIEAARADLAARVAEHSQQIAELQQALAIETKNSNLAAAVPKPNGARRDGGDTPEVLALKSELARLTSQEEELGRRYGPRYPSMVDVKQKISALNLLIDAQSRIDKVSATISVNAGKTESGLRKILIEMQSGLAAEGDETARLEKLAAVLQAAQTNDAAILNKSLAIESFSPPQIEIVRPASASQKQEPWAARAVAAAIALLAALVLVMAIRARRKINGLFQTPDDVWRKLGLTVAGIIPTLTPSNGAPNSGSPADALVAGSNLAFVEAFRTLQRTFGLDSKPQPPLAVAVCSAMPDEGKTTVSICFARSAALSGHRVVLLDCDGRRGALSGLVGNARGPGLVQLLRGEAKLDQAIGLDARSGARFIRHSLNDDVQDLSNPNLLKNLLDELRTLFDLIILDTGPVLLLAEARVIAALSDEVLLVTRWRKTPVKATRLALNQLVHAGARIKGVALTQVESH